MPFMLAPMDTVVNDAMTEGILKVGGIPVYHRNHGTPEMSAKQRREAIIKESIRYHSRYGGDTKFISIAVGDEELAILLHNAGVTAFNIETANAFHSDAISFGKWMRRTFPDAILMAGNVADPEGICILAETFHLIRHGIGQGAGCRTSKVAKVGRGIVTSLVACIEELRLQKLLARDRVSGGAYVIADQGLLEEGDFALMLALGGDFCMAGRYFARAREAPGERITTVDGMCLKRYRGMASADVAASMRRRKRDDEPAIAPEGVSTWVEALNVSVQTLAEEAACGVRSLMSYLGVRNLAELRQHARFRLVSEAVQQGAAPMTTYDVRTIGDVDSAQHHVIRISSM